MIAITLVVPLTMFVTECRLKAALQLAAPCR